jgi:polyphenol oxidase
MVKCVEQNLKTGHFTKRCVGGDQKVQYGFFSKHGGKSRGLYESLNVGLHVDDDVATVRANREYIKQQLQAPLLLSAHQVHGTKVYQQKQPLSTDMEVEGYDALVTNMKGVALMVQHADCQPVLLYDSVAGVIAAVHNGWRGSVQNILAEVASVLVAEYSSKQEDIRAVIGPSLGPCCAEFIHYKKELPEEFHQFMVGESYFDFWQISQKQLVDSGLLPDNIEIVGNCTVCSQDFFSYRKAVRNGSGVTGRNGSVIVLH